MKKQLAVLVVIAIAAFLAGAAKPETRRYVNIPRPGAVSNLPFSDGVIVGDTLYLAGRIGIDPKTNKPPADAEQEAKLALDGIQATLHEAGMTMDDLVYVQVFCPDVTQFPKFNTVYRTYFKREREFPARAFIGSGHLLFEGRFEVQGIAVKR
ncbi:MAG: Endoribonuclease [Acidobacteriaceae bacterium]|nr:Endoribonuclease [Acidobacteriaceae bacterium]